MIQVAYHRERHRITITGHARSGEPGRDLVCAAATMLAYTAAQNVHDLFESKQARTIQIRMESGNAEIECSPEEGYGSVVTLMMDTICTGFALLADQYPEYISLDIPGVG